MQILSKLLYLKVSNLPFLPPSLNCLLEENQNLQLSVFLSTGGAIESKTRKGFVIVESSIIIAKVNYD